MFKNSYLTAAGHFGKRLCANVFKLHDPLEPLGHCVTLSGAGPASQHDGNGSIPLRKTEFINWKDGCGEHTRFTEFELVWMQTALLPSPPHSEILSPMNCSLQQISSAQSENNLSVRGCPFGKAFS
jgi:hypothetical protein